LSYLSDYQSLYVSGGTDCLSRLEHFVKGLVKCPKKKANCEGIADQVEGHDGQSINHFVSESFWDAFLVMDRITVRSWNYLSRYFKKSMIGLIIDESGFKKHGGHSVCVGRQWLGCLGKQDNGQVFVGASLCAGKLFSLVQMKLFMPQSWEKDRVRRKKCRVPKALKHETKTVMARKMIEKVQGLLGTKPFWVGFDSLYGCCYELLFWLEGTGQRFMGEIKDSTHFYTEKPEIYQPITKKGKKAKYYKTDQKSIRLTKYLKNLNEADAFSLVGYREGTKSYMEAIFHRRTIWIWDKNYGYPIECELLIKKEEDGFKASWANMSKELTTEKLAYMQGQRYFVEQSFKESKNQVAMGDYQVRSWEGTHRHVACSMLALNFLMEKRHQYTGQYEHITVSDIVRFICLLIPDKLNSIEKMYGYFIDKHEKYKRQINRANQKRQT
jgi:SRSO17 transposase